MMKTPRLNQSPTFDALLMFDSLGLRPTSSGPQQCIDCAVITGDILSEDIDPTPHRCGLCAARGHRARQDALRCYTMAVAQGKDGAA